MQWSFHWTGFRSDVALVDMRFSVMNKGASFYKGVE